ncbi:RNA dependent RNA polymerase-domain-containing protein [Mycena maculata]|uniref:RNA-dependent RNA polymerase n=1 Tax=Mycena maculata TaxID=230809 RepID=A0AAD7HM11_9AGAR|nr:RNA dependent RNA polymerase-domain-containing protein [Mycena maculata]
MYQKTSLSKKRVPFVRLTVDPRTRDALSVDEYNVNESRATRLVGDSRRFMTVAFIRGSKDQEIRSWLENITQPGKVIDYNGDKYVFLGFTESNLKAGHVLFFREGPDFTVNELKENFGDLKVVYDAFGYGKYAARLGLSFSSTTPTQEIEPEHRMLLPDLTAADGSLTSDGCGLIRDSYAREISVILGIPFDTSVYQIRLGGIKGTLTRCPDDLFDELCGCSDKKIAYRPSMVKYNEGPHILEVQQVSKPPKSGRLNKQFILLLLTLGIPFSVFEELLQMQLDEIDKITTHREKALECVDGEVDAEANSFHQELYEMLLAGHAMNEPYLATLLRRFQTASREVLRKKLNIPVKGSGYLLGVVDHSRVLKEGEVYVNLPAKGGPQIGPVAAMRNPAFDPSGVRVLQAVNKPELRHLTNCIVFAASGAHSETDRMGGGDLDGDSYFVLFTPTLIPRPRQPQAPATTVKKTTARSKTITVGGRTQNVSGSRSGLRRNKDMRTDAIDTFVRMRCNFLLGALSNEWMGIVGTTPALADSPACKALVPMIEASLDIVKSGGSLAILRSEFDRFKNERIIQRRVPGWEDPLEALADLVPREVEAGPMDFTCDPQLVLRTSTSQDTWETLVRDAETVMPTYNRSLQIAIDADRDAKLQGLQEDERRADLAKAAFVSKHFPPVKNMLVDLPQNMLKASVWYFTGYKKGKQSFAWLGARWLNQIKATACGIQSGYVPISVGGMSTALAIVHRPPPPSSPERVNLPAQLPATPVSLARPLAAQQMSAARSESSTVAPDESDSEDSSESESDIDTDEFELVERESAYDTALEELAPVTARMFIDAARAPRRMVRENSDETLVEVETELAAKSRPRARAPPSPISPPADGAARPYTRARASGAPAPAQTDANVTTTRPRTRAQTQTQTRAPEPEESRARTPQSLRRTRARPRAVYPTPAPRGRARVVHSHEFLIRPGGARVCVCGAVLK